MKVIAGLGNPGANYTGTPHNAGFDTLDVLAVRHQVTWRSNRRFQALLAHLACAGQSVVLAKPQTYMNLSGQSVLPLLRYHNATPEALTVVVDDVDLPLGTLRIRASGGSGGHRGLASIIEALGTDQFARLRIGVGRSGVGSLVEHVLHRFGETQAQVMRSALLAAAEAVESLIENGLIETMNRFNGWSAVEAQPQECK